jgi:hypothetical protein
VRAFVVKRLASRLGSVALAALLGSSALAFPGVAHAEPLLAPVDLLPRAPAPRPRMTPPRLAPLAPPPAPPADEGPSRRAVAMTAAVVAALGAGVGATAGVLALRDRSSFEAHPTGAVASRGNEEAVIADVGLGAAVLAAVTSVVLFLRDDPPPAPGASPAATPRSPGAERVLERIPGSVSFTPSLTPHGVGAGFTVRF